MDDPGVLSTSVTHRERPDDGSGGTGGAALRDALGCPVEAAMNGGGTVDSAWLEALQALRALVGSQGFTTGALLALAVGIGANTAILCMASAALIRLRPIHGDAELVDSDPLQLVHLRQTTGLGEEDTPRIGLITRPEVVPAEKSRLG